VPSRGVIDGVARIDREGACRIREEAAVSGATWWSLVMQSSLRLARER
jgi:hypothetical protein